MNHEKTSKKVYWFKNIKCDFHKISYIGVVLLNNY